MAVILNGHHHHHDADPPDLFRSWFPLWCRRDWQDDGANENQMYFQTLQWTKKKAFSFLFLQLLNANTASTSKWSCCRQEGGGGLTLESNEEEKLLPLLPAALGFYSFTYLNSSFVTINQWRGDYDQCPSSSSCLKEVTLSFSLSLCMSVSTKSLANSRLEIM